MFVFIKLESNYSTLLFPLKDHIWEREASHHIQSGAPAVSPYRGIISLSERADTSLSVTNNFSSYQSINRCMLMLRTKATVRDSFFFLKSFTLKGQNCASS